MIDYWKSLDGGQDGASIPAEVRIEPQANQEDKHESDAAEDHVEEVSPKANTENVFAGAEDTMSKTPPQQMEHKECAESESLLGPQFQSQPKEKAVAGTEDTMPKTPPTQMQHAERSESESLLGAPFHSLPEESVSNLDPRTVDTSASESTTLSPIMFWETRRASVTEMKKTPLSPSEHWHINHPLLLVFAVVCGCTSEAFRGRRKE